jgi:hypothetical protein
MEYIFAKTTDFREIGLMILKTMGIKLHPRAITKANLRTIGDMAKDSLLGKMDRNMKDNG